MRGTQARKRYGSHHLTLEDQQMSVEKKGRTNKGDQRTNQPSRNSKKPSYKDSNTQSRKYATAHNAWLLLRSIASSASCADEINLKHVNNDAKALEACRRIGGIKRLVHDSPQWVVRDGFIKAYVWLHGKPRARLATSIKGINGVYSLDALDLSKISPDQQEVNKRGLMLLRETLAKHGGMAA